MEIIVREIEEEMLKVSVVTKLLSVLSYAPVMVDLMFCVTFLLC